MIPSAAEAVAQINLYSKEQGGRSLPLNPPWFGCPLLIEEVEDGYYHDCRFWLGDVGPVFPGQTAIVLIAFLDLASFVDKIIVGRKFKMWDGRFIGEGVIVEVLQEAKSSTKDHADS